LFLLTAAKPSEFANVPDTVACRTHRRSFGRLTVASARPKDRCFDGRPAIRQSFLPALLILGTAASAATAQSRGDDWWRHVEILAADDMQGRQTGSPDFDRAAEYVIGQFRALGLEPAGTDGFRQPVLLEQQVVDQEASTAELASSAGRTRLTVGDELIVSAGSPRPAMVDAPLVFAGYGLHMPEVGHDDFAGLELNGKILVVISGGPADISGALKSHARSERSRIASERGAVGILTVDTPKALEIPWDRRRLLGRAPGMYPVDAGVRDVAGAFLGGAFDPARAELLFARSGHSFADIAALADASKPVPTFALKQTLKARIATRRTPVRSYNLLAKLPGADPALRGETVVLSAHLDHLGIGAPIAGDLIYNGAMDDASGVAALLEIARKFRTDGARPRRSIAFAMVTAEEKGLLGSKTLAARPTPAIGRIVANLNFDMPLPLWRLRNVIVLGADESSLGVQARAVGAAQGLPLVPDPVPDRNSFTRSDQYSYVRVGVPAVAFKFGFAAGTPEAAIEKAWRSTRYHSPSDDLGQPVEKEEMVKLNDFVAALALRVADAPERPTWNPNSFFRRFAK
jgi:Zn-dependent M28 family amino/carboxypeptidase